MAWKAVKRKHGLMTFVDTLATLPENFEPDKRDEEKILKG